MKKVFFVVYGGGHVNVAIPVMKSLVKRGFDVEVLALSVAMEVLRREGIAHYTIDRFKNIIMDDTAWKYGRQLAEKHHVDGKGITREQSEMYLGCSMRDLVAEVGEAEAIHRLEVEGRRAFLPVPTMSAIIKSVNPDVIVTTNVPRMERAAVRAGNQLGIPTVAIHDYFAFEKRHFMEASRIAVMCDIAEQNLLKSGHEPKKVIITGQPAFDFINDELRTFDNSVLRKKWNLPLDRKLILLGTQPNPTSRQMVEACARAVAQLDGYDLVVKPHPGEDGRLHNEWIAPLPNVHLRIEPPIRELIFMSDLTITIFSTVGFESVLMGKPLIQLNLTGQPNPIPLHQFGVSENVEAEESLLPAMRKCLFDDGYRAKFEDNRLHHFEHILNGNGTGNVVKLIEGLITKQS